MSRRFVLATLTLSLGFAAGFLGATAAHAAGLDSSSGASGSEAAELDSMAAMHQHDHPAATPAATTPPSQPVTAQDTAFGAPANGFLARPTAAKADAPRPAIIVIHEWWGLNDNIRDMTRRLAGEGYTALAVDLYGGKVATDPDTAKQLVAGVMANKDAAAAVLRAADEYLKKHGATKVGIIGWCFGGGWSLNTALDLPRGIDAAVMYYGQPVTDRARLGQLHAPLAGFFGADDGSIAPAKVHEMEATLKSLGKSVEVHIYDGAGHAFANPSGTGYRPAAAEDAWQRTVAFFKKNLQGA